MTPTIHILETYTNPTSFHIHFTYQEKNPLSQVPVELKKALEIKAKQAEFTAKKNNNATCDLSIQFSADEVRTAYSKAYKNASEKVKIPKQEISELKTKVKPEWGSQIRSYVLNPYKMVKDHRTGMETTQAEKVLQGELDDFIQAELVNSFSKK